MPEQEKKGIQRQLFPSAIDVTPPTPIHTKQKKKKKSNLSKINLQLNQLLCSFLGDVTLHHFHHKIYPLTHDTSSKIRPESTRWMVITTLSPVQTLKTGGFTKEGFCVVLDFTWSAQKKIAYNKQMKFM